MNGLEFYSDNSSSDLGRVPAEDREVSRDLQWSDVIPAPNSSLWQVEGIKRLIRVLKLPENWDSYNSQPPSQIAVNLGIRILAEINQEDILPPTVVPVSGGGVQLEWSVALRELELEISRDGLVEYLKTQSGEPVDEGRISHFAEVRFLITWLISAAPGGIAA